MTVNDRFPGSHGRWQWTCQAAQPSTNTCLCPSFSPSIHPRVSVHTSSHFLSPSKLLILLHSVFSLFHPHTSSLLHPFLHPPPCLLSPRVSLLLTLPSLLQDISSSHAHLSSPVHLLPLVKRMSVILLLGNINNGLVFYICFVFSDFHKCGHEDPAVDFKDWKYRENLNQRLKNKTKQKTFLQPPAIKPSPLNPMRTLKTISSSCFCWVKCDAHFLFCLSAWLSIHGLSFCLSQQDAKTSLWCLR